MKKVSILLTIFLFFATSLFAQKLSFQAVVRNSANELVPNTTLTVAVSVLDASNNLQYSENHAGVQTNQNGLLSLMVGDGTPTSATTMADVVWNGASIRTVITLPGGATITNTTPVNAVPYALSAGNVDPTVVADAIADYLAHHSIGGEDNVQADWDETDPTNDAYVQHKPTDVSAFNNDANYVTTTQLNAANYITAADVPAQVNADWNATSGAAQIMNKPTIPTVPANVSEFNNDANYVTTTQLNAANYITAADIPEQVNADWNATSGAAQIMNKPTIPTVPANVSEFNNDANYVTTTQLNAANYITAADIPAQVNADWNATSGAAQILNKPTIPTVPANVSEFNNDANYVTTTQLDAANYITAADVPAQVNADWNATSGAAQIMNKPTIPTVPTNVSAFNNDAEYVNNSTCDTIDFCSLVALVNQLQTQIRQQDRLVDSLNASQIDGIQCPGTPTITDYDGNVYNTVKIGNQCWMKENLRTTHFADGTEIRLSVSNSSTSIGYRYYPNNDSTNITSYGYLYNRIAAGLTSNLSPKNLDRNPSGVQGVCPLGWHIPSQAEWLQLRDYLNGNPKGIIYRCNGGEDWLAKSLASTEGWTISTNECAVGNEQENNNISNFNAKPAGKYTSSSHQHEYFGERAIFWSCTRSTSSSDNNAISISSLMYNGYNHGIGSTTNFADGLSIRCIRD